MSEDKLVKAGLTRVKGLKAVVDDFDAISNKLKSFRDKYDEIENIIEMLENAKKIAVDLIEYVAFQFDVGTVKYFEIKKLEKMCLKRDLMGITLNNILEDIQYEYRSDFNTIINLSIENEEMNKDLELDKIIIYYQQIVNAC